MERSGNIMDMFWRQNQIGLAIRFNIVYERKKKHEKWSRFFIRKLSKWSCYWVEKNMEETGLGELSGLLGILVHSTSAPQIEKLKY